MKVTDFTFAVTADQRGSRTATDRVPAALAALADVPVTLAFERTAGDEIQALLAQPQAVVEVVRVLTRLGDWRIGIGVGPVESPLPASTRQARGGCYLAAREAVESARTAPTRLVVRLYPDVGGSAYREQRTRDAQSVLWLVRSVWQRRSDEGWELMDLLDDGLTSAQAAARLGISPSAVSQRLARAQRSEAAAGQDLAARLLAEAVTP